MHDDDLEAEQRVPLFAADASPLDHQHEIKQQQQQQQQQQEQTAPSSLEAHPQQHQVIRSRSAVSSTSSSNQHHHSQQIGSHKKRRRRKRKHSGVLEQQTNLHHSSTAAPPSPGFLGRLCNKFCPKLKCHDRYVRSTLWIMNIVAKLLLWSTMIALTVAIVWYSYELKNNG